MAETYGLAGDGPGGTFEPIIEGTKGLAAEFARLVEAEGEELRVKRDQELLARRMAEAETLRGKMDTERLQRLAKEAQGYRDVQRGGEQAGAAIQGISGMMQSLASGRVLTAAKEAFAMLGQWSRPGEGAGKAGGKDGAAAGGPTGGGEDSRGAAALGAFAGVGGAVVGVFKGIVDVGQTLVGSLLGLAKSASPAFGAAWTETMDYLFASIGQHIIPMLLPLGASVISMASQIGEATKWVVGSLGELGKGSRQAYNFYADLLGTVGIGGGSPGARIKELVDDGKGNMVEKDDDPHAGFNEGMRLLIDSMKVHGGQGGAPAFESASSAYKRITQSAAGTSDLRQKSMEIQRAILKMLEDHLPKIAEEATDDKASGGGGADW